MKQTALFCAPHGWFILSFFAMVCVACEQTPAPSESENGAVSAPAKPDPAPSPNQASPAPGAVALPPLAPDFPQTQLGEIPTSEDLEDEAENTVALQNLEAELDRLEAEIVDSPN